MNRTTAHQPDAERLELMVRAMRLAADDVLAIRLERPDAGELPAWTPGAHLDVRFGNGIERQYSLCSDPADRTGWEIAVLREQVSRGGSRFVHDALRPGQLVVTSHPLNTFELVDPADATHAMGTADATGTAGASPASDPEGAPGETLFIAGGIGITPLLPMVAATAATDRPWRLAYLGRSRRRMAYADSPLLAGPEATLVAADEHPRIDLAAWIGTPTAATRIYACGPQRLLDQLEEMSAAWPKGTLRVERFQPKNFADLGDGDAFEVEARRSGLRVTVDAGCSILEMLEQAGIPVPSSCLEGVCGTCETPIIDGEAEHRDSILSPDEQEANETMMVCVSRSKTPSLVLDL
jgi:ferredoxin-NADP reductase